MNSLVSTNLPSKPKVLIITVPTGKSQRPSSAVPFGQSAGVVMQLPNVDLPAGGQHERARVLSAESDQSGLLTS